MLILNKKGNGDEKMADMLTLIEQLGVQGIWCALFIYCFISQTKQAEDREQKLQGIIENHDESLKEITKSINELAMKIQTLGNEVEHLH